MRKQQQNKIRLNNYFIYKTLFNEKQKSLKSEIVINNILNSNKYVSSTLIQTKPKISEKKHTDFQQTN